MESAIFGFVGVIVGGLISGGFQYWIRMREEKHKIRDERVSLYRIAGKKLMRFTIVNSDDDKAIDAAREAGDRVHKAAVEIKETGQCSDSIDDVIKNADKFFSEADRIHTVWTEKYDELAELVGEMQIVASRNAASCYNTAFEQIRRSEQASGAAITAFWEAVRKEISTD